MVEIYQGGGQLLKVRVIMVVSLLCAAATMWWGWDFFQTYGLRPADGGELASLPTRLALGIGIALLGIAFAFGMWIFGRCYVSGIRFDEAADKLHVGTVRFFGNRDEEFRSADIVGSTWHEGRMDNNATLLGDAGGVSVDAPWTSVRILGRRLPLIVDGQGQIVDRALATRLLGI